MKPKQYPRAQPTAEAPSHPLARSEGAPATTVPQVQKYTPYSSSSFKGAPQHPSPMPTVSWQALRTFAPEQRVVIPDAPHVPIRSLHLGKALVRVSGRTVRAPDIKAFPDKFDSNKRRWLLTFTIKDDSDTIDIKFWHKSREHLNSYLNIILDQVVHILTDEVKLNNHPATGGQTISTPSTSSPFFLNLSEGKFGHTIDVASDDQQKSLFKHALGANTVGSIPCMSIKQVLGAISSLKNQRFHMVICVKKIVDSTTITTKNGPLTKTELCVFDAHGAEMSLVLWGDQMTPSIQQWIPFTTVANASEVTPIQIRSHYGIHDIKSKAESLSVLETVYGYTFAIVSELGIDNRADILTAKCPACKSAVSSFKMEVCSTCNTMPPGEECWRYDVSRYISFMDDTGELHHPLVPSAVFQNLLGFKCTVSDGAVPA
ncbi:hypothetical protein EMPS_04962 [Entomortierella parvispora]|uniref:MEIOB-like N-terminal domain-containing protein n=1 Tax=Entomortierella parvispora TaxID=205924 RepID=A0A9P3H9K4_9FUNG|nr:hypothetical protein EMPS_04962 [Entomortierella parvispora]